MYNTQPPSKFNEALDSDAQFRELRNRYTDKNVKTGLR